MGKRTGLILAWDKSTYDDSDYELLWEIGPYCDLIKVGLEAMWATCTLQTPVIGEEDFTVADMICSIAIDDLNIGIMWDAKLHDIGNTVRKVLQNILEGRRDIKMLTVHAAMSDDALRGVARICAQADVLPLAVTVLTDINQEQCFRRFDRFPDDEVALLSICAKEAGIKGLVCSPQELEHLSHFPNLEDMTKIVPSIRPAWAPTDDQKRIMTPAEAAKAGADYIVVGRPILQPPAGMTPLEAVKRIREELSTASA